MRDDISAAVDSADPPAPMVLIDAEAIMVMSTTPSSPLRKSIALGISAMSLERVD